MIYIIVCSSGRSRGASVVLTKTPFRKPPDIFLEDALKLRFLKGSAMPFFLCQVTSLPGYKGTVSEVRSIARD